VHAITAQLEVPGRRRALAEIDDCIVVFDNEPVGKCRDRLRRILPRRVEGAIKLGAVGRKVKIEANTELLFLRGEVLTLSFLSRVQRIGNRCHAVNTRYYLVQKLQPLVIEFRFFLSLMLVALNSGCARSTAMPVAIGSALNS